VRESLGLSLRKACLLVNLSTFVYRYRRKPDNDDALRHRLQELAEQRKRFGSPRLHILLKREGLVVNHKRTERLYREEGLALRKKKKRKGAAGVRVVSPSPQQTNKRWSMDFVTDSIITGRRFDTQTHRKTGLRVVICESGEPCRDRTCDPQIKSLLLYQLS
jgi:putative transposase